MSQRILSMYTKDIHEQMKDIGERGMKNIDKERRREHSGHKRVQIKVARL